ncbi:MAG: hypothetical protein P8Q99_07965 [Paracoccaceae bacterium]|mgnify:FL=1|nr:hypothetical protein [Paracoccaceae bacterium]
MFWLTRKLLIPLAAFGLGMYVQSTLHADKCLDLGGRIGAQNICQGAKQ